MSTEQMDYHTTDNDSDSDSDSGHSAGDSSDGKIFRSMVMDAGFEVERMPQKRKLDEQPGSLMAARERGAAAAPVNRSIDSLAVTKTITLNYPFKPLAALSMPKGTMPTITVAAPTKGILKTGPTSQNVTIIPNKTTKLISRQNVTSLQKSANVPVSFSATMTETIAAPTTISNAPTHQQGASKIPANTIVSIKKMCDYIVTTKPPSNSGSAAGNTISESMIKFLGAKPTKEEDKLPSPIDKPPDGLLLLNLPISTTIQSDKSNSTVSTSAIAPVSTLIIHQSDLGMPMQIRQEALQNTNSTIVQADGAAGARIVQYRGAINKIDKTALVIPTSAIKAATFPGLNQIPKDTIVKKITSKEMAPFDIPRFTIPKSECNAIKSIEPTITIIPKAGNIQKIVGTNSGGGITPIDSSNDNTAISSQANSTMSTVTVGRKKLVPGTQITTTIDQKFVSLLQLAKGQKMDAQGVFKMLDLKNFRVETFQKDQANQKGLTISSADNCTVTPPLEKLEQTSNKDAQSDSDSLRNKILEKIKKSPRLQNRSKSTNSVTKRRQCGKRLIRLPSAPSLIPNKNELDIEKLSTQSTDPSTANTNINVLINTLFDSLECDEKLDESDKSKSVSPIENIPGTAKDAKPPRITVQQKQPAFTWHRNDPWAYIKWKQGIGYLCNSKIHFKRNEFGLIETLNDADSTQIDEYFEKTLNNNRPVRPIDDKQFICKICYRNSDYELCSIDCSVLYNAKHNRLKLRQPPVRVEARNSRTANSNGSNKTKKNDEHQLLFSWTKYLKFNNGTPAPIHLFGNPFPNRLNLFEVGMKLEAIDPTNATWFCVCTVVAKEGFRIKLLFDSFDRRYAFWRNADSIDIFPPGWCNENGKQLQLPIGYEASTFDWATYALRTGSPLAPREYFHHIQSKDSLKQIKVGMKLEAFDIRGKNDLRVATIAGILYTRVLIKFDGLENSHIYWVDISSPHIRPVLWHVSAGIPLVAPPNYDSVFSWLTYLRANQCEPVPNSAFSTRPTIDFQIGMFLEVVDRKVPALIRPATIVDVREYEIKVLYDRWPLVYAYWIEDDSTDIHPINWCEKTGHPIEFPMATNGGNFKSACGVIGCRQLGNAKNPDLDFHYNLAECPYEARNWSENREYYRLKDLFKEKKSNSLKLRTQSRSILKEHLKRIKMEPNDLIADSMMEEENNESTDADLVVIKSEILDDIPVATKIDNQFNLRKRIDQTRVILDQYGPQIQETYKLWKRSSAKLDQLTKYHNTKNPLEWSIDDVSKCIGRLHKCPRLPQIFREEEIDGMAFLCLTQDDLQNRLMLRLGPSIKIYNQIVSLREDVAINYLP